jgi:DNA-binding ferritin-like protein
VSIRALNGILSDSIVLHDLYLRCCRLACGDEEDNLRRMLDAHVLEQLDAIDQVIERIEILGGTAITHGRRAAELTAVRQPSARITDIAAKLSWLADVHTLIVAELRSAIGGPTSNGGAGTAEHQLRNSLHRHERQAWNLVKYLAESRRSVPRLTPRRLVNLQHPAGRGIR